MAQEPASVSSTLSSALSKAIHHLKTMGNGYSAFQPRLSDLKDRLESGRLHLAVLGQFKRGKSTLLNAILGEEILPTAVIPQTAIPTFLEFGPSPKATVHFEGARATEEFSAPQSSALQPFLSRFVTEDANPKNRLDVSEVYVTLPAPLLEKGLVFIDTPGIGSTFRHNTEATINFLPQCDAALFLISSDPPITETEIEFLRRVRKKVARLFFILNKVDYLTPEERIASRAFLQRMLSEQLGFDTETTVFCISAKQALEAKQNGNEQAWQESGLSQVQQHLVDFLTTEKIQTLRGAIEGKTQDVLASLLMHLQLERKSLELPAEELRERLAVFEHSIGNVQLQRQHAKDLLSGDKKRMLAFLEKHAAQIKHEARHYLHEIISRTLTDAGKQIIEEKEFHTILADAIPGWFEHQSGTTIKLFRARMNDVLKPHQQRADQLIERIRKKAADLFDIAYYAPESEQAFEMVRRPSWVTHKWYSTFSPVNSASMDRFLPIKLRKKRIRNRLEKQINALIISNVENLRWAMYQSINESFRHFAARLDEQLAAVLDDTQGAIKAAIKEQARQGEAVSGRRVRLEEAITYFSALKQTLR